MILLIVTSVFLRTPTTLTCRSEFSVWRSFTSENKNTSSSRRLSFFLLLLLRPVQSFRVHSGGCLISFHSRFFTVTLCRRPICRRPGKSHYSYTWGKNRPFISIVVVNTNQRGHIDPCFFFPPVCIKSLFFFRDCWVFLSLRGRRFKSSPVGPLRGHLKGAVRSFEEERDLHRLAFDAFPIKLSFS